MMDFSSASPNPERRIKATQRREFILLGIYFVLIFLRCPKIFLEGRFWAEEGKYYFTKAVDMDFWPALVSPQMGYYSLVPNLAALIAAKWTPLELAPYATIFFALIVQFIPAWLILFTKIDFLKNTSFKALALALVLFILPNQQIWLNTISSHFYLCLCAGLILISGEDVRWKERVKLGILTVAGLTGVVSVFLTPFFWCKAVVEKTKSRLWQAGVLTLCAAIQGSVILSNLGALRSIGFYADVWLNAIFSKMVLLPLTGIASTGLLCNTLREHLQSNVFLWSVPVALLMAGGIFLMLIWKSKKDEARYLFYMAFFVIALSLLGAYESASREGMIVHVTALFCGRYYYAPNVFVGLALLAMAGEGALLHQKIKYALMVLVVWIIVMGALNYFWTKPNYFSRGANWREEVSAWRKNPEHPLQLWPDAPWWSIKLRGEK